jgi:hypothetical protein
MAISTPAMIQVPTFDLETRRMKESIGVPARLEGRGALGGGLARIKPHR